MKIKIGMLLSVALVLSAGRTAHAQLNFTLDNASQTAAPNGTVYYGATLQNLGSTPLTLDSSTYTLDSDLNTTPVPGTVTDNFNATPASLTAAGTTGDTYTGTLFQVLIGSNPPPNEHLRGTYTVNFTQDGITNQSVTRMFDIAITPTPAPPGLTAALLGCVGPGIVFARRRFAASRRQFA